MYDTKVCVTGYTQAVAMQYSLYGMQYIVTMQYSYTNGHDTKSLYRHYCIIFSLQKRNDTLKKKNVRLSNV